MNLKLFTTGFRDKLFLFSMFFIFIVSVQAQKKVSGTVLSGKSPLPGASVIVKGTTMSASTDFDGRFQLSVPSDAKTLVVSYLGFATEEVAITGEEMKISLLEESKKLDEVVVNVGYGTQKKSVVTGAISRVSSRDLEKVPNGRIEQSLQGRVAGVTVAQNSGQPGSASTMRIRGITSFNNDGSDNGSNPLWVIDGIVVDKGGIGYLNQSDIESIEVLKDGASASIYGTRGAKGVILVTTKKGKAGEIKVNYNGFFGVSSPSKTLKLLNATQYATIMNEKSTNDGGGLIYSPTQVQAFGVGTDWQKAIFNDSANRYSHELSFSGGNDRSNFYVSFGIQDQQGIIASDISNFTKKNIRLNSTHKISNVFTFGQTVGYTHQKQVGIGTTNSVFGGVLGSAINLDPITPLIVTDPVVANGSLYTANPVFRDEFGNPYGISTIVGQEMTNPLAYMKTRKGNYGWSDDIVGNVFLEAAFLKDFKFKSSLGAKLSYWGDVGFTPKYFLNAATLTSQNSYGKSNNNGFDYNIENTLVYSKKIGNHNFNLLLGQGAYKEKIGGGSSVRYFNLPIDSYENASFNFDIPAANKTATAYDSTNEIRSSLFTRLSYDYKEKYLLTAVLRRDGSSKFGANKKYANFPGVSLGWVVSKENFWKENDIMNTLKFRAGYGKTGNDNIGDFKYLSLVQGGSNYTFGNAIITGYAPVTIPNPDLSWEETVQTNFGLETKLFNALNLSVDLYKKKTTGILQYVNLPGYVGATQRPAANVADMNNSGVEVEFNYRKKIGGLNFSANGSFATLKNEVVNLGSGINFITDDRAIYNNSIDVTRTQVGESYNSFFGFQTAGVFQNMTEVNAYTNTSGGLIQPLAVPGDFRWVDNNGDGKINDDDKVVLGSPIPKYTYGLTLNFDYKSFDLMLFSQGAAGNKIFGGTRRLIAESNYQTDVLNRWNGEGTSNDYPRLTTTDANENYKKMSDFYLQKGDYLRLKVVQLGYSLPNSVINKIGADKVRLFISGENLYTLTKYRGYDPEIGGNVMGIDQGYYPQARTFMFGANLQF